MTAETVQTAIVACLAGLSVVAMLALGVHRPRRLAASPDRRMPWGVGVVLAAAAVFLLSSAAFGALAASLDLIPPGASLDGGAMPPGRLLLLTLIGQAVIHGPLALLLVALASRQPRGLRRIGLIDRRWGRHALTGVVGLLIVLPIVFLASIVATAIAAALGIETSQIGHALLEPMFAAEPPVRWGFFASAVVVAPVLEELIFRGLVQTSLLNAGRSLNPFTRRTLAIGGATVVFLLLHVGNASAHAMPALAVLSIALGYLYERTGSLVTPIVAHAGFNAVNIALAAAIVSDTAG